MNFESARLFHIGVNYIVTPVTEITRQKAPGFYQSLINAGVDIDGTKFENKNIIAERGNLPLRIQVGTVGPKVAQLLVIAPNPHRDPKIIIQEIEAVIDAFIETWETRNLQLVASDATIRYLFESDKDHAFQELWEDRLKQTGDFKEIFGKPVAGGGLKLVIPALQDEDDPKMLEIKIESFIREPKQFFVDIQCIWQQPVSSVSTRSDFRTQERINYIENFIETNVRTFMERI